MSTVSDKNKLVDVNFRKFTMVIVVGCFDKNHKKKKFAEKFMHKTKWDMLV